MPGYRQWSDGDNLTPADIDGYLMGQTVMRFANAATRSGQIATPVDGMQSYLQDTGLTYRYDSTAGAWVPLLQVIKKAAQTDRVSTTTLTADPHLTTTLTPGQYEFRCRYHVVGANAGDISINYTFTGTTSSSVRSCLGMGIASTDGSAATTVRFSGNATSTAVNYGTEPGTTVIWEDMLWTVTAAGVFTMQWAQNASSTAATSVSAASRIVITAIR